MSGEQKPVYWFPAKRSGWGWGFPATWQGWMVMVVYILAIVAAAITLQTTHLFLYIIGVMVLSGLFITICFAKGEPPRWQ